MTRTDFLRKEGLKRGFLSWSLAFFLYALLAGLAYFTGLGRADRLAVLPSPVWIELKAPQAVTEAPKEAAAPGPVETAEVEKPEPAKPVPPAEPVPEPAPPAPAPVPAQPAPEPKPQPAPAPAPKPQPPSRNPLPKSDLDAPSPAPPPASSPTATAASPAPSSQPLTPTPAAASAQAPASSPAATPAAPADPWTPGPRPQGSRVTTSESAALPQSGTGFSHSVKGKEQGNSLETVLGAQQGKAGRTLYVPIYLYMPLPSRIEEAIASRIPAGRKDRFLLLYAKAEGGFKLVRQPPLAEREELWIMLEEAGYDLSKAEYKTGGRLKPISMSFIVTPAKGGIPRLEAVELTSGSGDRAVDEAVLYGFRRAGFFNATDGAVSGTFTYKFE